MAATGFHWAGCLKKFRPFLDQRTAVCCNLALHVKPRHAGTACSGEHDPSGGAAAGGAHREKISLDGALSIRWPGRADDINQESFSPVRQPGVPLTAPAALPISEGSLEQLVDFLTSCKKVLLITGAGTSTESGTPDYRGPSGAYSLGYKPMTHQQFMGSEGMRSRYWARNYAGWKEFSMREPNSAHIGVAALQRSGWIGHVITQNVDGLHQKANARNVLELHGTVNRVVCTDCGDSFPREEFQSVLSELNPEAYAILYKSSTETVSKWQQALRQARNKDIPSTRPDGDLELSNYDIKFQIPDCSVCGGILKPDVVFFGDGVPQERAITAMALAQESDGVFVMGSSVMVYSAYRLVKAASDARSKLAIVNIGTTRADALADLKVEALAGEVAARLASHIRLLTPRIP